MTERYRISAEAAALVKWFTTLRPKEWLGNLSPQLEENLQKRIGISSNWDEKNFSVYFSMLADEITDQTEWKVTVVPWSGRWGGGQHRLLVKHKPATLENAVRQIQMLGISEGKLLPTEMVEASLRALLETPSSRA